jgi:hypothetical protein
MPWRLQSWMGHKRIDETMLYVHVAENHRREIPACVLDAGQAEIDPDRRVLGMLGARGQNLAKATGPETKKAARSSPLVVEIRGIEPDEDEPTTP